MSLTLAHLLPGLILLGLGAALVINTSAIRSTLLALPRSRAAAYVFFGAASLWFLHTVWHLPEADFGDYRNVLFAFFALVAVGAFLYVPDFLAVRGLAVLMLLAANPLLGAGYMNYQPQVYPLKVAVYAGIVLAIWLGASPFRLRDFLGWLYRTPGRPRVVGSLTAAYGVLLCALAFV